MGYRSEVAFCLQLKEPEKFVALLKLKDNEVIKEMMQCMYLDKGLIHFHHTYWKWYEDSSTALGEIVEMAENYDDDFAGRFARYGEETDDNEEDAWGNDGWDLDYPYVVRNIELGFNPKTATKLIKEEENENDNSCKPT
jgi:hypothetical protein